MGWAQVVAQTTPMHFSPSQLAALIVATTFAAGLNVYATVATLGLLSRFGWIALAAGLHPLTDLWVISIALTLFVVEFFADKIPVFDVLWNAGQTFVRVPVAALLAFKATAQLSPVEQLIATTAGGLIAALAHSSKTTARVLVTPSPEPLSNIALSTAEDGAAIGLTWFATHHPYTAASFVVAALLMLAFSARWAVRRVQRAWLSTRDQLRLRLGAKTARHHDASGNR